MMTFVKVNEDVLKLNWPGDQQRYMIPSRGGDKMKVCIIGGGFIYQLNQFQPLVGPIRNQVSFCGGIWLLTFHPLRDATYLVPIINGVGQKSLSIIHPVCITILLSFLSPFLKENYCVFNIYSGMGPSPLLLATI